MNTSVLAAASAAAASLFGRPGELTALDGELDLNFLLTGADGRRAILKLMRPDCDTDFIAMQCAALRHLEGRTLSFDLPRVIVTIDGADVAHAEVDGQVRLVWMLEFCDGTLWAEHWPQDASLRGQLGASLAQLGDALSGFEHPALHRGHRWELTRAADTLACCDHVRADLRPLVRAALQEVAALDRMDSLPAGPIHNDANDYNVLVRPSEPVGIAGLIDFGDISWQPLVCELAVACAYACLHRPDAVAACADVVRGYHSVRPLQHDELTVLLALIRGRLALSVAISSAGAHARPDDPYVTISQAPAIAALQALSSVHPRLALVRWRQACGLPGVDVWKAVERELAEADIVPAVAPLSPDELRDPLILDLSVGSLLLGADPANAEQAALGALIDAERRKADGALAFGRYAEPRLLYGAEGFGGHAHPCETRRTVHLGIDVFCAAGTEVRAPLAGVVVLTANNTGHLDYGPLVILQHRCSTGEVFFTLYGHLMLDSIARLEPGLEVAAGDCIARVGEPPQNGDWPPHLHLQLILDLLDMDADFPGVCASAQRSQWQALSPNPWRLAGLDDGAQVEVLPANISALRARRRAGLGPNLSLSYREPLHIVRGFMQYLYDSEAQAYLDLYNNVAHVGHCHPQVVAAATRQMALLNTNTRYLHDNILEYADRLRATLPPSLTVCYFVNSGSEANELALRLARAHTRRRDMLVMEAAYHGHSSTLIELSPYKYRGPGGEGQPDWVHEVPLADDYRGRFRRGEPDIGRKYGQTVADVLSELESGGRQVAGFIHETQPSVGGQIILPDGYLASAYAHVRQHGGVCIADEVQVGFGRLGSSYWGFEGQGVVPDMVVLGKPIGNGFPMAAVITTREIADSFDNGMEFFATFGGNPVACAVGMAVMDVIDSAGLQARADELGRWLHAELRAHQADHDFIGDVRGRGLFLGVDIVTDPDSRRPSPAVASYLVNRLREERILAGVDGPAHNVVKMRPSMVVERADLERVVAAFGRICAEPACRRLSEA